MNLSEVKYVKNNVAQILASTDRFMTIRFEFENEKYVVSKSIYSKRAEVCVWADNGMTSLTTINCTAADDNSIADTIADTVVDKIIDYANGYILCADCGTRIKRSEIAGGYFAGRYCRHCWESKWKAIEAAETYD